MPGRIEIYELSATTHNQYSLFLMSNEKRYKTDSFPLFIFYHSHYVVRPAVVIKQVLDCCWLNPNHLKAYFCTS